ncbi:MAG: metal-dependent transcriptional regulator [Kiritimatiellia bacterium]
MTQSLEDYLETIYVLIRERKRARVRDVASSLGVKMPSVIKAVQELKAAGLVEQEPYGDIRLTRSGEARAKEILARHHLLRDFLVKLGVPEEIAGRDACLMEHILSAETLERIRVFAET